MSTQNLNYSNLDGRYSRPADVSAAIAAQATADAGQYINNSTYATGLVAKLDKSTVAAVGMDAPSVAKGRPHDFDTRCGSYNMTPTSFRLGRSSIANARAGLGVCDITIYGDSRAQGSGLSITTKAYQTSWVGRLRSRLTGATDSGLVPLWNNLATYDDRYSFTGTWTDLFDGPFSAALKQATSAATYTFTGTFDSIAIYYLYGSSNFTYSLDGASAVTINGTSNAIGGAWARATVSAGALSQHTITVSWVSGTLFLGAFEPRRGTTGFRVHSIALAGQEATHLLNSDGSGWNSKETTWLINKPNIGIIDLAINAYNNQIALATVQSQTQTIINLITATGTPVLVAPFDYPAGTAQTIPLSAYISLYYDLADTNNIPLIDLNWQFKSDAVWPANPSGYYADGIHFKELGHSAQELVIANALNLTALNS